MPRLEVLVEEPSAEAALRHLLPKLVPVAVRRKIVNLKSKPELLKKLEARLRAYHVRVEQGEDIRILVLVDRDDDDCLVLKRRLAAAATRVGLSTRSRPDDDGRFRVVNRVVVEELESWFLGDPAAVRAAFPAGRQAGVCPVPQPGEGRLEGAAPLSAEERHLSRALSEDRRGQEDCAENGRDRESRGQLPPVPRWPRRAGVADAPAPVL